MKRRNRVRRSLYLSAIVLALGGTAPAEPPVELYRRAVPVEATMGVISIRQSVARQVEVPEKCEDEDSMECTVVRHFDRIWRIDFEVETRRRGAEEVLIEREGRGVVYLALTADRRDEEAYDEYLRKELARLGAAAFDEPFAGLSPSKQPFGRPVATRAVEPAWSCFEDGGTENATQYSRQITVGDDGRERVSGTSSSGYGSAEFTGPLCSALEDATAGAYPEVLRTMSTPRLLVEERLRVDVSDTLPPQAYADELVELPEGAWMKRKAVPGVRGSTGMSRNNEIVESRVAVNEIETSARVIPAELPVAAARDRAWHSRWTLEMIARRLGPLPESHDIESWSITASLLPTLPPREIESGDDPATETPVQDDPYPVRLNEEALFASVAESLDFHAEMTAEALTEAIVQEVDGLDTPGWILVICREDAQATWGLAPTRGRARLLNGDAFCGVVRSLLPS